MLFIVSIVNAERSLAANATQGYVYTFLKNIDNNYSFIFVAGLGRVKLCVLITILSPFFVNIIRCKWILLFYIVNKKGLITMVIKFFPNLDVFIIFYFLEHIIHRSIFCGINASHGVVFSFELKKKEKKSLLFKWKCIIKFSG